MAAPSRLHAAARLRNKAGSTAVAPTNTDPEHQFSLRSSLDLPGRWQLDAGYRCVARIVSQRLPAYDELEVRLGWNPAPALELSLIGQNLLRPRHAEFNAAPTRQEIARSLFGKAVWRY